MILSSLQCVTMQHYNDLFSPPVDDRHVTTRDIDATH